MKEEQEMRISSGIVKWYMGKKAAIAVQGNNIMGWKYMGSFPTRTKI